MSEKTLILGIVSDLLFTAKIRETADGVGSEIRFLRNEEDIKNSKDLGVKRILVDLNGRRLDPFKAIEAARSIHPEIQIVGFFSHVDEGLREQALQVGASLVMPRSQFVKNLPALLQ